MTSRPWRAVLAVALLCAGVLVIWAAVRAPSPAQREAAADALAASVSTRVTVQDSRLLATRAVADFGVGQPVRLVLVRIVDELQLEARIEASTDLLLAPPIVACLVGPDAAPDDAGLSSPCWGVPDLGPRIEAQLPRDDDGHLRLMAGASVTVSLTVRRGETRCDYPPGAWQLELRLDPVVDGGLAGPRYAPDSTFEVFHEPAESLQLVTERRYCGLANRVFREQGEPLVAGE